MNETDLTYKMINTETKTTININYGDIVEISIINFNYGDIVEIRIVCGIV